MLRWMNGTGLVTIFASINQASRYSTSTGELWSSLALVCYRYDANTRACNLQFVRFEAGQVGHVEGLQYRSRSPLRCRRMKSGPIMDMRYRSYVRNDDVIYGRE